VHLRRNKWQATAAVGWRPAGAAGEVLPTDGISEEVVVALPHDIPPNDASARGHVAGAGAERATDAELMAAVGAGDAVALGELMRRHWKPVVSYATALVDADTAEDIGQETFLRVAAQAGRWRPVGPVRAYLLRIARNLALNEHRKRRSLATTLGRAHASLVRRLVPTPAQVLDETRIREAIRVALAAMPARRREVFALIRFGGLTYAEAASVLGTSPQTVANQMSSALADLRHAIHPLAEEPA
jgi:RNA polymerase sigma-70 factor (ECF subfamily)